ncbi:MAG: lysine 2,3-aminomutase [Alphaproteobacteria bacterium RIFOXYD12_FULL_60_8]|nr:MAG: lysine 2,3-aminomutase [Alphaproteobacteria bacterium RIFOXYD12_FULL_60_8]
MSPLDHHPSFRHAEGLTEHLLRLIDPTDPADPIARQFLSSAAEALSAPDELADPIGDKTHSPLKGLVHRYPDRVLLTPVMACAAYCRFCFRRETVGQPSLGLTPAEMDAALAYIQERPEIWEVILSGGDPLLLSAARLRALVLRLDDLLQVKVLRIHTRLPIVDPVRITEGLVEALTASAKTVYVAVHANHPRELTEETARACARLIQAGIPLLGQTVLLKGVNDDLETLSALMRSMVEMRIKPYYLHQCDPAPGTAHFRVPIAEGKALMAGLWKTVSGIARPTYVLDGPDGGGKRPLV